MVLNVFRTHSSPTTEARKILILSPLDITASLTIMFQIVILRLQLEQFLRKFHTNHFQDAIYPYITLTGLINNTSCILTNWQVLLTPGQRVKGEYIFTIAAGHV